MPITTYSQEQSFIFTSAQIAAQQQSNWYVDWVSGNDANPGTISSPVKSVMGGVVKQWGTNSPILTQTTTLHIVSSQPVGAEEIILTPQLSGPINFNIIGTPTSVATPTLNVVTQKNRTTNANFHCTGLTGLSVGQLLENTTNGKKSSCFVRSIVGGDGYLTQPLVPMSPGDAVFEPAPVEIDTWSHNDTTDAYTLPTINLQNLNVICGSTNTDFPNTCPGAFLQKLHLLDASGVVGSTVFSPKIESGYLTFADCVIDTYLVAHNNYDLNLINCYMNGGELDHAWIVGGIVTTYAFIFEFPCWLDGDFIVDVTSTLSGPEIICANVNVAAELLVHPQSTLRVVNSAYTGAILWGLGTLDIEPLGLIWNSTGNSWATTVYTKTLHLDGATSGTKYVSGTFTDGITLNQSNIDGYGGLQNPKTGARYV